MSEMKDVFNGKDLTGWNGGPNGSNHEWCIAGSVTPKGDDPKLFQIDDGEGVLVNGTTGRTANLWTDEEFGDFELSIEFVVPKGSNSGIYFLGQYEIQILDSWGAEESKYNSCGGIYCRWIDDKPVDGQAPLVNASRPLMLQGDHGPVAYRNIRLRNL